MNLTAAKTVVIGGADGALGSAAWRYFAKAGHRVFGSTFTQEGADKAQAAAKGEGLSAQFFQADLGQPASVDAFRKQVIESGASTDWIFNAAGGFIYTSTVDCSQKDFDFLFHANFVSCWNLAKAFTPDMLAKKYGRFVFVSSRKTQETGQANFGIYTATKAAVDAMTDSFADELKLTGVTVNLVSPTVIDTPANRAAMPDADPKKWVTTADILNAVHFLCSDQAARINGSTITLSGGL